MRAAAYDNPNRPGTHLPRKIALHRPSFLIECPELDTDLTCTKQTADPISNRQFFALLKFPDTASAARSAQSAAHGARRTDESQRKAKRRQALPARHPPRRAGGGQAAGRRRTPKKSPTLTKRAWGTPKINASEPGSPVGAACEKKLEAAEPQTARLCATKGTGYRAVQRLTRVRRGPTIVGPYRGKARRRGG